jgi:3-hydroxyisobutyrate dehydrogenase
MVIGIVGLGNMGFHIANRLLAAGEELVVYDANESRQAKIVERGARGGTSVLDLASKAEIVILSLPLPGIVKDVAVGAGNVVDGSSVRIILDLSTTGPGITKEIADVLAKRGIAFVSAPVSGGPAAAQGGTLAVMAAGNEATFHELEPILRILGKNVFYLGADPHLGQTMKIINNTLYATSMIASCEALVYGVKAGLDAQTMLDVLNVSSGRSFATLERIPQCVMDRGFPVRFTTELLHKDVKMCIEDAERIGSPMMVSQGARQFLAFALTQGDGDKDNVYIIRHFEQWAGVQVGEAPKSD